MSKSKMISIEVVTCTRNYSNSNFEQSKVVLLLLNVNLISYKQNNIRLCHKGTIRKRKLFFIYNTKTH